MMWFRKDFLELWNRMDALDTELQIESYLYKTVYSRALNYLKRYKKINTAALEDINEMRMSCYLRWVMASTTWKMQN